MSTVPTETVPVVKMEALVKVEEPQQETKKRKAGPKASVIKLNNFNFARDATVGPLGTGTFKNAKVTKTCDHGPLIVSLSGGGDINKEFGVEVSSFGGLNVNITLNEADHQNLANVHEHMLACVVARRDEFFPGSSKSNDFIKEMANATCHTGKKKKDSDDHWSASMSIKVDKVGDLIADARGMRKCKVKNQEGDYVDDIYSLKGCRWFKAVIEIVYVYVQSKGSFGISKRLRLLTIGTAADELEIDTDSEEEEDDNKRRKC